MTSELDPNKPKPGSPLNSSELRENFAAILRRLETLEREVAELKQRL